MLEYILSIKDQISSASRWCVVKKLFCQNVFGPKLSHRNNKIVMEFITLLRLYFFVDMIQSLNVIVCWYNSFGLENSITKNRNLMMLDDSGIDYARIFYSCLVYWKIAPATTHGLLRDYKAVTSMLSKKNVTSEKKCLRFYFNK